jgi:hypothetical protein
VVIGYPHCPAVRLGTVAEYFDVIPAEVWPEVRFSWFGPVGRPAGPGRGGDAVGQALADLLARPVIVGTGVRICGPDESGRALDWVLLPDGAMAWLPFTTDYGFTPRAAAAHTRPDAPPPAPVPIDAASSFPGPAQAGTGVFDPDEDEVFEVIQSELWVRSRRSAESGAAEHGEPAGTAHADPADDTFSDETAGGVRDLAADMLQRLAGGTRAAADAPDAPDGAAASDPPDAPAGPGQTRKGPVS